MDRGTHRVKGRSESTLDGSTWNIEYKETQSLALFYWFLLNPLPTTATISSLNTIQITSNSAKGIRKNPTIRINNLIQLQYFIN